MSIHHVLYCSDVNDPNGLIQQWPEYTMANQEYIIFQTGDQLPVRTRMRDEHVHFWNEVVPAIKKSREQCVNEKNKSDVTFYEGYLASSICKFY